MSADVVRMTGIALSWKGSTVAFGSAVSPCLELRGGRHTPMAETMDRKDMMPVEASQATLCTLNEGAPNRPSKVNSRQPTGTCGVDCI
jgi:hypothetical protein